METKHEPLFPTTSPAGKCSECNRKSKALVCKRCVPAVAVRAQRKLYRARIAAQLETAQQMVDEDAAKGRDTGTSVLFAGICIPSLGNEVVIRAPFQGNVGSQIACLRAMKYLRDQGIPNVWYDGVMD